MASAMVADMRYQAEIARIAATARLRTDELVAVGDRLRAEQELISARGAVIALSRDIERDLSRAYEDLAAAGGARDLEAALGETQRVIAGMNDHLLRISATLRGQPSRRQAPISEMAGAASPPGLPPAQWVADPTGRHEIRFWDGVYWTTHVADGGRVSVEDLR